MNDAARQQRLIWLAEVPFDGIPHRQSQLARRLANRFEVVFVEPPPPLRMARRGTWLRNGVRVGQVVPLLNARPAPLRIALHAPVIRRMAARLGSIQLSRLTPKFRAPIVVCSNVYLAEAVMALRPTRMIVDMCDDPRHYPGEPPWTHELLVDAIRSADLVTTSSRWLQSEFQAMGARRVEHVANGVSDEMLRLETPTRSQSDAPVIGFVGYLGPWIDLELIDRVAATMPTARVVLAGSVDPKSQVAVSRVLRRPNVEHLGFVPPAALPEMIAGFNLGLMPFRVQPYTRSVNPIKLYEYAAQNLPVVSTAFSRDVEEFRDWIDICATSDDFVAAVRYRAQHGSDHPTRWIAEANTWRAIADRFADLVQEATTA